MAAYTNAAGCNLGLKRIEAGVYEVNNKKYFFIMKSDNLMMRSGAGVQNAHKFLDQLF